MSAPLHILVSNDDGISSGFLRALVESLKVHYRVTVVAPQKQYSWIGRALTRHGTVKVSSFSALPCQAYQVTGTPSDCVNIALGHLLAEDPPSALCAGINLGFNVALPLLWSSGTLAAALEGAMWGLPSLAFSHCLPEGVYEVIRGDGEVSGPLKTSLEQAAARARTFLQASLQAKQPHLVHNINFPQSTQADTPVESTVPGFAPLGNVFSSEDGSHFTFASFPRPQAGQPGSDIACLERGHISDTVIDTKRF